MVVVSSDRMRWFHTLNIYFMALTYGIATSVYGASLLDVAEIYGSDAETVSYTLMTKGAGFIFASIIAPFMFKACNSQLVLLVCVVYGGVASLLTTILPSLVYLHVLTFALGLSMGSIEIAIHVWLQVLWREKSGSFFHVLNFLYGFGGILAPVLCEPFLSPLDRDKQPPPPPSGMDGLRGQNYSQALLTDTGSNNVSGIGQLGDIFAISNTTASTELAVDLSLVPRSESSVFIAYCLIAVIYAANALFMLIAYCLDSTDLKAEKDNPYCHSRLPKRQRLTALVLFSLYLTVGVACEFGFSQMVTTFAVRYEPLRFTKSQAAHLTSVFWASCTLSRIESAGLSLKLGPAHLIVGSQVLYVLSAVLMLAFIDRSPLVVWAGTALLAFGVSPYWSNGSAWVVQYLQLTHGYMSATVGIVSSGVIVIPFLIGSRIERNPASFLYSNVGLSVLLTAFGVALIVYGNSRSLRAQRRQMYTAAPASTTTPGPAIDGGSSDECGSAL